MRLSGGASYESRTRRCTHWKRRLKQRRGRRTSDGASSSDIGLRPDVGTATRVCRISGGEVAKREARGARAALGMCGSAFRSTVLQELPHPGQLCGEVPLRHLKGEIRNTCKKFPF